LIVELKITSATLTPLHMTRLFHTLLPPTCAHARIWNLYLTMSPYRWSCGIAAAGQHKQHDIHHTVCSLVRVFAFDLWKTCLFASRPPSYCILFSSSCQYVLWIVNLLWLMGPDPAIFLVGGCWNPRPRHYAPTSSRRTLHNGIEGGWTKAVSCRSVHERRHQYLRCCLLSVWRNVEWIELPGDMIDLVPDSVQLDEGYHQYLRFG